ncbi:uncharacterized protein LOC132545077 [Ylistrum balloti]|uniref:uncharacterized protein LOC132545077 n=1 Tax=Ylistrum balloti TaxID=509963 RepID=UPI002905EADC|nr:uncharacterized protein LOC132545077 [Ylistrum balloti]
MKTFGLIASCFWLAQFKLCSSHQERSLLSYMIKEETAKSFLATSRINRRSAELCANDEWGYCEVNKDECRKHVESTRESRCQSVSCPPGMTCYMSTPCPSHFATECDPNPCLGMPCENGATCTTVGTNYTCTCKPTYYGHTCSYVDACHTSPCENGATCHRDGSNFNCSCTNRFTGSQCTQDCRPGPADIVIILDGSTSTEQVFNSSRQFAASFVEGLSIDSDDFRVAMLTYSVDVHVEFNFTTHTNKSSLLAAIKNVSSRTGISYLHTALMKAQKIIISESSPGVQKYVLVVSDGLSTRRQEAIGQSQLLRNYGVKVLCVGIGRQVAQEELLQIAYGISYVFTSDNNDALNAVLMETADTNCIDCVLNNASDIVLLVDVSKHQNNQLQRTLDMIRFFIQQTRAYISDTRFALVTFDVRQHVIFSLTDNQHTDSILVKSQIGITSSDQESNASSALSFVRTSVLSTARDTSRKFVVVFSDESLTDVDAIVSERQALNMDNVTVAFVPVGSSVDPDTVYSIAYDASDVYYIGQDKEDHDEERLKALVARTAHDPMMKTFGEVVLYFLLALLKTNACLGMPCENGATCTTVGTTYKCTCTPAYYGSTCSYVNGCLSNPCANGGTCTKVDSDFRCGCTNEHQGETCQQRSPCYGQPCKNGATCQYSGTTYTCACNSGFYGVDCENVDACLSSPCQNGATCHRVGPNFNCSCTDRYTGSRCSEDCRPGPADIVIILDGSTSTEQVFNSSRQFAISFVEGLSIDSDDFRVAMITYSVDVYVEFEFNTHTNKSSLLAAMNNVSSRAGVSYLHTALRKAKEILISESSPGVQKYVLVVSDGLSTRRQQAIRQSRLLRNYGVKVLCVGIGRQVAQEELLQIASDIPYVFTSDNNDALNAVLMETANVGCTDCVLNNASDIVLLVDVSKHQNNQLQRTLDIIRFFIQQTRAYISDTRFALVTFDVRQHVIFSLTDNQDTDSILVNSQIGITSSDQESNASSALSFVRTSVLSTARDTSRKFVVVFSNEGLTDVNAIVSERQVLDMDNVTVAFVPVGNSVDLDTVYSLAYDASDVYYIGQDKEDHDEERLKALVARTAHVECDSDLFSKRQ